MSGARLRRGRGVLVLVVLLAGAACEEGVPGGPSPIVGGWPAEWSELEEEVLVLVNQRRAAGATCGDTTYPPAGALTMQPELRASARGHSEDMGAQDYFDHTSLDGRTFSQRIRAAGYTGSPIAENIAAGYSTPQAVVTGWMNSPGHCRNIMSPNYRVIGVGYAFTASSSYRHYWTQNFGGS